MAKNKNKPDQVEESVAVEATADEAEAESTEIATVEKKDVVKTKKPVQKKQAARPNGFKRAGRWIAKTFKEMASELKKVTWPKFPDVVKNTGVVLGVVLCFLILIGGIDALLSWLLGILVG